MRIYNFRFDGGFKKKVKVIQKIKEMFYSEENNDNGR